MTSLRIYEKDIFAPSGIVSTNSGNAPAADLWEQCGPSNRWSLHSVWTVNSFTNKTFGVGDVNTTDDTITIAAHGYETGLAFTLTTSGTLPSPFLVATTYYVISVDANTIKVATSKANSLAGTAIDITTTGSGTQTVNVSALSGGSVTYQISNNGTDWVTGVSSPVTATSSVYAAQASSPYRYIRVTKNITNGSFSFQAYMLCIGELT